MINAYITLLELLWEIKHLSEDQRQKLNLEIEEYESRNTPWEKDPDEDEPEDVLLQFTDPLHVKAFKQAISNITRYATEKALKALSYHPWNLHLNTIAAYWFV